MKKSKITGIVGTVAVHLIILLLLFWLTLSRPAVQEEGGVPVMLGNTEMASGDADPYTLTEVDVLPQPESAVPSEPEMTEPAPEQPMITQDDEPSIQVKKEQPKKQEKSKKEQPKKETVTQKPQKPVAKPAEKTEAEKRAEAERAAAEAAASKIAGAFGKGSKMGSKGNAASGSG
ncbi:MAG: energy transducer TonB, partial [Bacteroides sp.]|nr:energy transducer TonB [Bacteroides sp.]